MSDFDVNKIKFFIWVFIIFAGIISSFSYSQGDIASLKKLEPVVDKHKTIITTIAVTQQNIQDDIDEIKDAIKDIRNGNKELYEKYEDKITQHYTQILLAINQMKRGA